MCLLLLLLSPAGLLLLLLPQRWALQGCQTCYNSQHCMYHALNSTYNVVTWPL
jgi:hypothetical protein